VSVNNRWPLSPVHTERVYTRRRASTRQIKLKIVSIHTDRVNARQVSNLHTSNERCQFKLYIGYWTSIITINAQNVRVAIELHHQTCANDVIDNDVTDNDVIDSWMNMHTLLGSRPNVVASTLRDALGVNGALHHHTTLDVSMLHASDIKYDASAPRSLFYFHGFACMLAWRRSI